MQLNTTNYMPLNSLVQTMEPKPSATPPQHILKKYPINSGSTMNSSGICPTKR